MEFTSGIVDSCHPQEKFKDYISTSGINMKSLQVVSTIVIHGLFYKWILIKTSGEKESLDANNGQIMSS